MGRLHIHCELDDNIKMDPALPTATPQKLRQAFVTQTQRDWVPQSQKPGISSFHVPLVTQATDMPSTPKRQQGSLYGLWPTFGWDCSPFSPPFGPARSPGTQFLLTSYHQHQNIQKSKQLTLRAGYKRHRCKVLKALISQSQSQLRESSSSSLSPPDTTKHGKQRTELVARLQAVL